MNEFVDAIRAEGDAGVQAPLPRPRRAAHRRHPVPRAHPGAPGGVLPHVQPAPRRGRPDRHLVRPPAEVDRDASRTGCAPASSGASSPTSSRPSSRPASRSSARRPSPSTSAASRPRCSASSPRNISDNVRELEGALIRVAAYSSLNRAPLSEEVARQVLADLLPPTDAAGHHPRADPRRDRQDVRLDRRRPLRQEPAPAARHRPPDRHVRVARAHRLQLPTIAEAFGGRDHTTVMYAVDKIEAADDRAPRDLRPGQRAHRPHPARQQWIMLWRSGDKQRCRLGRTSATGVDRSTSDVENGG